MPKPAMSPAAIRAVLTKLHADPAVAKLGGRAVAALAGCGRASVDRFRARERTKPPAGPPRSAAVTAEFRAGDAADLVRAMPDRAFDLVFFSPPFEDARTYGIGFALAGQAWVDWLAPVVADCCRVSNGLVLVNAAGVVRNHSYSGAVEMLVADLIRRHGVVLGPAPYAWAKNGQPGSGNRVSGYHRRDWEPVYAFALPDRLPLRWSDNLAFGTPPADARTQVTRKRNPDGSVRATVYRPPAVCNSGNVVRVPTGAGHLGSDSAGGGEASMPEALADRFVRWYCPPGGTVLDPMCGTVAAAVAAGRSGVGFDLRPGQVAVCRRRLGLADDATDAAVRAADTGH